MLRVEHLKVTKTIKVPIPRKTDFIAYTVLVIFLEFYTEANSYISEMCNIIYNLYCSFLGVYEKKRCILTLLRKQGDTATMSQKLNDLFQNALFQKDISNTYISNVNKNKN